MEFTLALGKPKKERQVYRYHRKWKERKARKEKEAGDLDVPPLDDPVDWVSLRASMASFGISRETLPLIRVTHAWAESTFHRAFATHLTYRSAKWYSYVLDYVPSIRLAIDLWAIGEQYAYRDRTADLFDEPMQRSDLDAWLTYQPWLNEAYQARYLDAVKDGIIPELPEVDQNLNFKLVRGENPEGEGTRWAMARGMISAMLCRLVPGQRHQLPYWQLKCLASSEDLEAKGAI